MRLPPSFETRLVAARMLTPGVRELSLERVDGAPFDFAAGQWVNITLPLESGEIKRAYSIASSPRGTPRFELAITKVDGGPGSSRLHELEVGAPLHVIGPQGFFTRPLDKAAPSIFVATGTGLTPLRSMLHAAVDARHAMPIWLVFGVRTEEDILYRDELEEIARAHPNVRVRFSLSRPHDVWTGHRGYVQTHVRGLYEEMRALDLGAPHVYVCGLARMVSAVRDLLRKEMGLPRELVHTERYD